MTILRQRVRLTARLTGGLVAAGLLAGPLLSSAFAQGADVKIDTLSVGKAEDPVELKGIEFLGTNLSRDEVVKLLSSDTASADRTALATRLKASSIAISEIVAGVPAKGPITLKGLRAESVDQGKIERLFFAGAEAGPTINGEPGKLRAGSLTIDQVDVSAALKGLQDGGLGGAAPKGSRMSWNGFEASFPDKDTPADSPGGNMMTLRLGAMDAQSVFDGDTPQAGSGALRNLTIEFPKASEAGKSLALLGIDKLDLSSTWHGSFNAAKKAFQLDDLTVSGVNLGSVGLRAEIGSFDPSILKSGTSEQRIQSLMNVDLVSTQLNVTNSGLFEKGIALVAKQQGKTTDALKAEWGAMVTQFAPMLLGGDPSSLKVAAALNTFVRDPKSLSITVKGKKGPVKIATLNFQEPMSLMQAFAFDAAANGAAGAAKAADVAPPAPVVAQVAPPAANAVTKLTGVEAWNQVVGNSVSGKTADGEALTEFYMKDGTLKQLIDDETTDGKWTVKKQQVCFVYGDDDDDDEECFKLEVAGNIATFIDSDGKGRRYTILKGNPKNL